MVKSGNYRTYTGNYQIKRPGDYTFYEEPTPYWEPAEDKFIIHYTKALVHGFGLEEGWDDLVGFPIEIKPLTRPYGLWAGNIFQGQVLIKGKPVPYAEIEITYDNQPKVAQNASDPFHIQVINADPSGVFTYAMPREGWWGFAALEEGTGKIKAPDGKLKEVEIGGLIWVHCSALK
jgi:cobalt/nickel transport protein